MISVVIPSLPDYDDLNADVIRSFKETGVEDVEYVLQVGNVPYAINVNAGLRKARGDIVLISNNDVTALQGWDTWLVHACSKKDGIVAMSPRYDCGWAFGGHRDVIDRIGMMDEKLVNSYDDYDYFIRAALLGYRRKKAPKYYLVHEGGHTIDAVWGKFEEQRDDRINQSLRNRDYMLAKWPGIDIDNVPSMRWAICSTAIMQQWEVMHGTNHS